MSKKKNKNKNKNKRKKKKVFFVLHKNKKKLDNLKSKPKDFNIDYILIKGEKLKQDNEYNLKFYLHIRGKRKKKKISKRVFKEWGIKELLNKNGINLVFDYDPKRSVSEKDDTKKLGTVCFVTVPT